jgi:CRP-like cAMP-binding protein
MDWSSRRAISMSEVTTIPSFLAKVPLLDGIGEAELEELSRVMREQELPAGTTIWSEGDEAKGMVLIMEGSVSVTFRLPGEREAELTSLGPGEILGEVPLLDGGRHSATARTAEPARLLSLSRADFAALVSRGRLSAFALKRRLAHLVCSRLRRHLGDLASTLAAEAANEHPAEPARLSDDLEFCEAPDSSYVRRIGAFRDFEPMALWGILTAGRYARCPARSTLVVEGEPSDDCYLTISGAVEKVLIRGDRRIRVQLAAPGQAFGYESLIDGQPSPLSATTRERALLLVLPREPFQRLFHGEDSGSHAFLDVIHRDLVAALRQALRPHARLAASV